MDTDGDPVPEPRGIPAAAPASLAEVVTVRHGPLVDHELVLSTGATASDLTSAMIMVPPQAALVSFHGDVDLSLVFRERPGCYGDSPEDLAGPAV
ncbi:MULTISPECIES: hypothetical protein [Protofrankia]|uniref:Uncharacterized protein n=2 Tax=Protofrankia TaxID=2994361 RepID=F8AXX4_9ACTN|nr:MULTISPECIES: hypothetical protein [Protofrankia]AEH11547.1 hypothetical protein FsymDg_4287 [Candidatus Protofrankia datiscae]KLL12241.1 hypothetical protein FrCorBMG51_05870 [Protofrankia coriariae]ONH37831.1 hypothetical protein BL254_02895 [Protofrankia sp. BMG5.30]